LKIFTLSQLPLTHDTHDINTLKIQSGTVVWLLRADGALPDGNT